MYSIVDSQASQQTSEDVRLRKWRLIARAALTERAQTLQRKVTVHPEQANQVRSLFLSS